MKTTEIMGLTIAIVFIVFISYLGSCIYDGVTKGSTEPDMKYIERVMQDFNPHN